MPESDILQGTILEEPKGRNFRAILLVVSAKARDPRQASALASEIRSQPGVRHIEAISFHSAWSRGEGKVQPPDEWRPDGALVFIEAATLKGFRESLNRIWATAVRLGTKLIRIEGIDDM